MICSNASGIQGTHVFISIVLNYQSTLMASEEVLVGGFKFLFQGSESIFKKMVNKVIKDVQLCSLVMSVK